MDGIVDLPFAFPTAVAGISLASIYAEERLDRRTPRPVRDRGRLHAAR